MSDEPRELLQALVVGFADAAKLLGELLGLESTKQAGVGSSNVGLPDPSPYSEQREGIGGPVVRIFRQFRAAHGPSGARVGRGEGRQLG